MRARLEPAVHDGVRGDPRRVPDTIDRHGDGRLRLLQLSTPVPGVGLASGLRGRPVRDCRFPNSVSCAIIVIDGKQEQNAR